MGKIKIGFNKDKVKIIFDENEKTVCEWKKIVEIETDNVFKDGYDGDPFKCLLTINEKCPKYQELIFEDIPSLVLDILRNGKKDDDSGWALFFNKSSGEVFLWFADMDSFVMDSSLVMFSKAQEEEFSRKWTMMTNEISESLFETITNINTDVDCEDWMDIDEFELTILQYIPQVVFKAMKKARIKCK